MPRPCQLCETIEISADEYLDLSADHFVGDGDNERLDYLSFKRALESKYNLSLAVSAVKRHDLDHISYSFAFDVDSEALLETADREFREAADDE